MIAKSVYKIPNGKLLKIKLDYNEKTNRIIDIDIMGDFFAYPEEGIAKIENKLKNITIDKDILYKKIESIIKKNMIQFIGLDSNGIVKGIMMCIK